MARPSRRVWPRVPLPDEFFDLLIVIAKAKGYDERTLYAFIYQLLKNAYPEDVEKLTDMLSARWIDVPPDDLPR